MSFEDLENADDRVPREELHEEVRKDREVFEGDTGHVQGQQHSGEVWCSDR